MTTSSGDPVIYLIGTSGYPNFGDEFVTSSWLHHLARTSPHAEVWVDSPRPGQSAVLHSGIHPNVRFVDTLYHAAWVAPSEKPSDTMTFGSQVIGAPGLLPREATGIENLEHVDVVHILGGSYISKNWPRHLALIGAAAGITERYGARAAITGASLTPFVDDSVDGLSSLLAQFDVVDVRDNTTREALKPALPQLTCTGDDSFLHPKLTEQDRGIPSKTYISVQNDFLTCSIEEVADYVVRTLKEWQSDDHRVFVAECLPPDDSAIAGLLQPHIPDLEILPFSRMWRFGFPTAPRARWITTRYHPHLLGAANGAWGVILPVGGDQSMVDPQDLIDAGSGWVIAPNLDTIVPWSRRVTSPFNGGLDGLRAAKLEVAEQIDKLYRA